MNIRLFLIVFYLVLSGLCSAARSEVLSKSRPAVSRAVGKESWAKRAGLKLKFWGRQDTIGLSRTVLGRQDKSAIAKKDAAHQAQDLASLKVYEAHVGFDANQDRREAKTRFSWIPGIHSKARLAENRKKQDVQLNKLDESIATLGQHEAAIKENIKASGSDQDLKKVHEGRLAAVRNFSKHLADKRSRVLENAEKTESKLRGKVFSSTDALLSVK